MQSAVTGSVASESLEAPSHSAARQDDDTSHLACHASYLLSSDVESL